MGRKQAQIEQEQQTLLLLLNLGSAMQSLSVIAFCATALLLKSGLHNISFYPFCRFAYPTVPCVDRLFIYPAYHYQLSSLCLPPHKSSFCVQRQNVHRKYNPEALWYVLCCILTLPFNLPRLIYIQSWCGISSSFVLLQVRLQYNTNKHELAI